MHDLLFYGEHEWRLFLDYDHSFLNDDLNEDCQTPKLFYEVHTTCLLYSSEIF